LDFRAGTSRAIAIAVEDSDENNPVTTWMGRAWINGPAGVLIVAAIVVGALSIPYHRLAKRVDRQLAGSLVNTVD
jgi:hypothetical protein